MMRLPLRTGARVVALAMAAIAAVAIVRALRFAPEPDSAPAAAPLALSDSAAAERLAGAVRIPTISYADSAPRARELRALHDYLRAAFPRVHAALAREVIADYSLLYTWRGSDTTLAPIVLMGHLDVVPVDTASAGTWTHPPFSGDIADGFVWGRGTLDDKASVLGAREAVEALLAEGFRPRRTIHLAFGHDEEVLGHGASAIAAVLRARGERPLFVLDEGSAITRGIIPGVARDVALIGIAEKGFASVELAARGTGGHSSMPPRQTAVGVLAAAIARLEAHQMPARLDGATAALFDRLGRAMPFGRRLVFANRWLFGPVLLRVLAAQPTTNASVRTTTAATVFDGGVKDNVLPTRARAVVNFRILPGDTRAAVLAHVRAVVDDPRVEARLLDGGADPSAVSSTSSDGYRAIERAARSLFPTAVVAPSLVVAATDSRHYVGFARDVYRFMPIVATDRDVERIHGTDERIATADYGRLVRFLAELIRTAAAGPASSHRDPR